MHPPRNSKQSEVSSSQQQQNIVHRPKTSVQQGQRNKSVGGPADIATGLGERLEVRHGVLDDAHGSEVGLDDVVQGQHVG